MTALVRGCVAGFILAAVFLVGCPKPPAPGPNRPDASDAAPAPDVSCNEACANVNRLGCKYAQACGDICPKVLRPAFRACVAAAASCSAIDACGR